MSFPIPDETLLPGYVWYIGICKAEGCPLPDGRFRRQVRQQHAHDEISYCSTACQKRARKHRAQRRCPTPECENEIIKPGAPCCGPCWNVISGMCLGKNRYDQMYALKVQNKTDWPAAYCVVCTSWHNTSHPTEDELGLQVKARAIMAGITADRGEQFAAELVASFAPTKSNRRVWQERRNAIRAHGQAA